jgi:2-polyprenyl-6-methoxyphenol hydroxylase-like FAD-dependent oxidoreductase
MMLGFLLARAGVQVLVLEKHADFFRDFRGDTIHPSTLELLWELGLLPEFLKIPHQQFSELTLDLNGRMLRGPDFSHLPTHCRFIALAPQWDFLNFLSAQAARYPSFQLLMKTQATDLLKTGDTVTGVIAESGTERLEIQADLVIGADGRHAVTRTQADFELEEFGVPIDVLWYRLNKHPGDQVGHALGRIRDGHMLITLDRGEYFQCGTIIRKGRFPEIQARGLEEFRKSILNLIPVSRQTVDELQSWEQIKLLTVQLNRLKHWQRPGLLCIGDAAHAMSPAGGVGVNIAVQDAVATANLLAEKLARRTVTLKDLQQVQRYREPAVRRTQAAQAFLHRRMFPETGDFGSSWLLSAPVRCLLTPFAPLLRRFAGRMIGMGIQPEHIHTPERL